MRSQNSPANAYDTLDRLVTTGYGVDSTDEVFTYDNPGNRLTHNPIVGGDIVYALNNISPYLPNSIHYK